MAVAWVDMPDAAGAAALKSLADRPGTGNITELSKEQPRYCGVRFTGQHYASLQDDSTSTAPCDPVIVEQVAKIAAERQVPRAQVALAGVAGGRGAQPRSSVRPSCITSTTRWPHSISF